MTFEQSKMQNDGRVVALEIGVFLKGHMCVLYSIIAQFFWSSFVDMHLTSKVLCLQAQHHLERDG